LFWQLAAFLAIFVVGRSLGSTQRIKIRPVGDSGITHLGGLATHACAPADFGVHAAAFVETALLAYLNPS
jgi:hypothetical protein